MCPAALGSGFVRICRYAERRTGGARGDFFHLKNKSRVAMSSSSPSFSHTHTRKILFIFYAKKNEILARMLPDFPQRSLGLLSFDVNM